MEIKNKIYKYDLKIKGKTLKFSESIINLIKFTKELENENVIPLKANKGNSIVLVDRHVYFYFFNKFLSNKTRFEPVLQNDNEYKFN